MRKLRAYQAVERYACLCGFDDEVPVNEGRNSNLEDPAVSAVRERCGGNLAVHLVGDATEDHRVDPLRHLGDVLCEVVVRYVPVEFAFGPAMKPSSENIICQTSFLIVSS
jgi:hypothetical protein